MEKAIKRYWPVFIVPTLLAFIIGFIVPFALGLWLSLCDFTTVTDATFVGFTNYIRAFEDTIFQHAFWSTALFAVVSLVVINVVAFLLAFALTFMRTFISCGEFFIKFTISSRFFGKSVVFTSFDIW